MRVSLPFSGTFSNTPATTLTASLALTPNSATTEYTELADLYDEVIVDGADLYFTVANVTNYTTLSGLALAVWSYDPINAGALGSLINGVQHQQHFLFNWSPNTVSGIAPSAHQPRGLYHFSAKVPSGDARTIASSAYFGHSWSSTSDTTQVYGTFKLFAPSLGATGVNTVDYVVVMHCRFRNRT